MSNISSTSVQRCRWIVRQVIIWSIFGFLYATPCYLLAISNGYEGPVAAWAMLFGVISMIAMVATLTSTPVWERCEKRGSIGKALSIGRILRGVLALLMMGAAALKGTNDIGQFAQLDFTAGLLASQMVGKLAGWIGGAGTVENTVLMTLLTGCGVLLTLSLISAGVWSILKLWGLLCWLVRPNSQLLSTQRRSMITTFDSL